MTEGLPKDAEKITIARLVSILRAPAEFTCNHRDGQGGITTRHIQVIRFRHGTTSHHQKPGLVLHGLDLDSGEESDFRVIDFDFSTLKRIGPARLARGDLDLPGDHPGGEAAPAGIAAFKSGTILIDRLESDEFLREPEGSIEVGTLLLHPRWKIPEGA
ncbi:hypothetical protein ACEUZ9_000899 [Paracoccus litorisediminis]|uniref:hypothetical protein n=1 Tax=Paracoccus litorisediminis TaxID=2006130 RepID=UPI00372FE950